LNLGSAEHKASPALTPQLQSESSSKYVSINYNRVCIEGKCMKNEVEKSAKLIIEKLLAVNRGERVLIIADDKSEMEMVNALFNC